MEGEQSAKEHLDNALAASLAGNQTESAIAEFERALALGLPGEREAFARVLLGGEYARVALRKGLGDAQAIRLPEWVRAESEITTGLRIDREGGFGIFSQRNDRSLLRQFDLMCSLAGSTKAEETCTKE